MYLNKAFIIGNLTRDPEARMTPSGVQVVSFGVATNRVWKDQQGEQKKDTQFHNIIAFGRTAEVAKQYLFKGSSVLIDGRIQTTSWDAQDGTKKYRTEIITERLQLGPRPSGGSAQGQPNSKPSSGETKEAAVPADIPTIDIEADINPEDIPF